MKKLASTILFLSLASAAFGQDKMQAEKSASDPRMTAEQRARAVELLLDSQKEFLDAVENITDAQWNYKPSLIKWSIGQVAEHIALTEAAIFSIIERSLAQPPNPDWQSKTEGKEQLIERILPSRAGRAQAPVEIQPSGKLTRDEIMKRFKQMRARNLEFAEKTNLPLKAHTFDNPFPVFNTLNAYDWLIYIPLHNIRHNKQIAEVKASPGYPK